MSQPVQNLSGPNISGAEASANSSAPAASHPVSTELAKGAQAAVTSAAPQRFGHIVSVAGPQAVIALEKSDKDGSEARVQIGALVKVRTKMSQVMGIISSVSSPLPENGEGDAASITLAELILVGEIVKTKSGAVFFRRGVASFPTIGDPALFASRNDLMLVYDQRARETIEVGTIYQDPAVSARFIVDELFSKHFLVVGATGCGKSNAISCILKQAIAEHPHAHILVLDIHSEYQFAFDNEAELVRPTDLSLPFWLLNFQELTHVLVSQDGDRDSEITMLQDAILAAKKRYLEPQSGSQLRKAGEVRVTLDSPSPYRLADVIAYIDEQMGRLERMQSTLSCRRVKARIETLISDPHYAFMFGNRTVEDNMASILGRLFRVPHNGRPLTILDLAAVPTEILDVVISLISRLAFDLALWSDGRLPVLLVCEEAHRYAPEGGGEKFLPTRQALARIAKEGRKYGVALALVTQRPSELDSTILSQCGTIVAMRLSTERDQQVIRANAHDAGMDLVDYLPLLSDGEAICLGQAASMPMRIRFHLVKRVNDAKSGAVGFSQAWKNPNMDQAELEETIAKWRRQSRARSL
jgi:DNA helicase HerA-like ATPase